MIIPRKGQRKLSKSNPGITGFNVFISFISLENEPI